MEYKVNNFTDLNQLLEKEDIVLYVKAKNCGVCEVLYPIIKNICIENDADLITIQLEEFREFSGKYSVFTVPTVIVLYFGKEMIRESRFIDQSKINNYFNKKRMLNN